MTAGRTRDGAARVLLCIVSGDVEHYGVGRVWADVLRGFSARGWDVVVAALEARHAPAWQATYPEVTVVAAPREKALAPVAGGRWSKLLSMAGRVGGQAGHVGWLTRLAQDSRASTLIVQGPPESLLAGVVARRAGLRALWLVPNIIGSEVPFDLNRRLYRLVFRLGRVVPVSNSRFTDSTFGPGTFERHVVHLGVDTEHFRPGGDPLPVRRAFGISEDAAVVGLFARMTPSKGQERLIRALGASRGPFHLLFCGGPPDDAYVDTLRGIVRSEGLTDRVHFAGPQADLRPYYAACDVVANLYDGAEGFGLTVAEAMACGKPVLAHGLGGPAEIVEDGRTGWLLPGAGAETVAFGLDRVLTDRRAWAVIGAAGRARISARFTKAAFVAGVEALAVPGTEAGEAI